jgi:hypothetical protein
MFQHKPVTYLALAVSIAALLLSAGCEKTQTPPANPSPEPSVTTAVAITATATQEPTPTSIPAAAIVNGEPIPLSYFNNEVWRYRDSLAGQDVKPDDAEINQAVINYLIEQQLLAQESRKGGYTLSESELQTRIDGLIAELGSQEAFSTWLTNNHYDDTEFRMALTLAHTAAWQRDQICATILMRSNRYGQGKFLPSPGRRSTRAHQPHSGSDLENLPGSTAPNPAVSWVGSRADTCST